jgi:hypothetical protein
MKLQEIIGVTLNTSILAVFYTTIGGIISYLLGIFVDEPMDEWKKHPIWYQAGSVSLQLAIIGSLAFWITYIIREAAPIFPVSKPLDELVDTYISGVFFAYAMFLFINYLDSKIQYLYHELLDKHIEKMFPSRKTDKKKDM